MPNTHTKSVYPNSLNALLPFNKTEGQIQAKPRTQTSSSLLLLFGVVLVFVLALLWGALTAESFPLERVPYQVILFTLCSAPYFLLRRNDALRLIAFFMLFYYAIFGAAEFVYFFAPSKYVLFESSKFIVKSFQSDILIIMGAVSLLAGSLLSTFLLKKKSAGWFSLEWKPKAAFWMALCCWVTGFIALIIVQIVYEALGRTVGFESHLISNASHLSLLGGIIFIYLALKEDRRPVLWLALGLVIACEYILGFVGNTKEISYRLPILLVLAGFFLRGSFNARLIVLIVVSFILYQGLFTAYRDNVLQVRRQSVLQAIESKESAKEIVLKAAGREKAFLLKSACIALDRVDCRKYIDMITKDVGNRVPYQDGETILALLYTFVPKMFWEDKPDLALGKMMNRVFRVSPSPYNWVPSTQLGELYWNYGLTGGLVGMFIIGVLLAVIGRYCALGSNPTVGKFLVVLTAAYLIGLRFEDCIAVDYSKLFRMCFFVFVFDRMMRFLGATTHPSRPPANAPSLVMDRSGRAS